MAFIFTRLINLMWKLLIIVLLIVPLSAAEITQFDVEFTVRDDSVHQLNRFLFDTPVNGTINYTLPDVRDITVTDGRQPLSFTTTASSDGYVLDILVVEPASQLIVEYTTDNVIFHLDSIDHFFTEFSFDNKVNLSASLTLPLGYTLYDNSFKPSNGEIRSDGRNIILYWAESNVDSVLFSVKFVAPRQEQSVWIAVIAILAGSLLFIYLYFHERRKEDMLFGFRHDEKIVINYIQEKKIALQRDLEEQFKFSRAKATRIVSKLVEKGLIKKQRYGRTNKLTWIK